MKKYKSLIIWGIVFSLLLAIAFLAYNYLSKEYTPIEVDIVNEEKEEKIEKEKASDFTVIDNVGNEVKLSDYFGKPIVVNFWATWCPPCKSELPYFDKMYQEYDDEVEFLMVNLTDGKSDTVDSVKSFISQYDYKFPVYFDTMFEAAYAYNLYAIPRTVFIDKDGNINASFSGAISEKKLKENIDKILEK